MDWDKVSPLLPKFGFKPQTLPKLAAIILICFSFLTAKGQQHQYLFSHLGTRDGLLSNFIQCVQQDSKGYIWIATHNGIQRYDGLRFLSFQHKRGVKNSLPDAAISTFQLDNKNRLWILTNKQQAGYFDLNDYTYHDVPILYDSATLARAGSSIYVDKDGKILFILISYDILTYSETEKTFSTKHNFLPLPPNARPVHIWQDHNKAYWMGTYLGLFKYNTITKKLSSGTNNVEKDPVIEKFKDTRIVTYAYNDLSNRFWMGSWPAEGLYIKSFDIETGETLEWQHKIGQSLNNRYYELHGILETSDRSLWLYGNNLFARYYNRKFEPIFSDLPGEYSIRYDGIQHMYEDREKNIWVSTTKGLYRFNPAAQQFRPVANRVVGKDTIFSADVTDILETADNNILVSTWGTGVFSYDKNFNPIPNRYARFLDPNEGMTWCMIRRPNGDIWRGAQDGNMIIYEHSTGKITINKFPVFENSTIRQVTADPHGNLWFGTQRGFIVKWTAATNSFQVVHKMRSIVARLYTDKEGNIWACTDNAGVARFDYKTGKLLDIYGRSPVPNKGLRINGASDIIQYNDTLYVISGDGLNFLNPKTKRITYYTIADGLPSSHISNLVIDKQGYIWMSCGTGILSYHPGNKKLSTYTDADGVHTNTFNVGSGTLLSDGRIAFGTAHDLIVFDPKKVTVDDYVPPTVQITGITLMSSPLNVDSVLNRESLILNYDEHSLNIQLSTLRYQNLYGMYYMMEGLDKNWVKAENSQATYNYLSPGTYKFRVGTRGANGEFGVITTLEVIVNSPFWKTWWFYCLVVLGLAALLYWIDKQRTNRQNREQQIRSSIASNLHEEVNTTLQNINVLSEIAGMKADRQPEQAKDYIHQIKQKSRNMVIALNDVLWSIDPANDGMDKMKYRILEIAESLRHQHNAELKVHVDPHVMKLELDMKTRHELMTIYKIAVVTLVELMQARETTVQMDYLKGVLQLRIFSTAADIRRASNTVLRNLREMKARAESLHATVDMHTDDKSTGLLLSLRI